MTQGVLIVALGHNNYGRMALNLAASIRYLDKRISIHLVYTESAVVNIEKYLHVFTSKEICNPAYSQYKGKTAYIKSKVHIYDLSPFDKTLFLDADTIWLPCNKKASEVMDELSGVELAIANKGFFDFEHSAPDPSYSQWVAMEEVRAAYNFSKGKYYSLHSEFIYFEKCDNNVAYFQKVKDVFENPIVSPVTFAGAIPDEVAYSIASILCNHYPHQDNYLPVYWQPREKKKTAYSRIHEQYYLLSIGGKMLTDSTVHEYDRLARAYASKENIANPFLSAKNAKMNWLPERKLI